MDVCIYIHVSAYVYIQAIHTNLDTCTNVCMNVIRCRYIKCICRCRYFKKET